MTRLDYERQNLGPVFRAPGPGSDSGSETVLVVEDEEVVRGFVVSVLRSSGYRVVEAEDAEAALERLERADVVPDLLVTDVVLPGVDGRVLAERIRRSLPGIPVLFVSGYGEQVVGRGGILEDGIELLQKPFGPSELSARIRDLLDAKSR